jgi:post-segregation antitoxin (ccd killing protein)
MASRHVNLELPDDLAREAEARGLLDSGAVERLLREELRRRRVDQLFQTADRLASLALQPLTEAEVQAEIESARKVRRPPASRGG